ncbi:MAG: hypothetical protein JNK16_05325 [Phycisphaerales bacterium]|nr:hypothetical protein [Phycisphaerales bacterium]
MMRTARNLAAAAALCAGAMAALAGPVGTNFPYQGRLTDGGAPANGVYDIQLLMFNAAAAGTQIGSTQTFSNRTVSNGVFTLDVSFGAQFDGEERWIEVRVRPGDSVGAYTTITPRTEATATPYAQGLKLPVTQEGTATNGLLSFTNTNTSNTAHVLKLTSVGPSGNSAGITFQPVLILDTNDGNGLASYTSADSAFAAYFSSSGTSGRAISAVNSGTGHGISSLLSNTTNGSDAVNAITAGTGRAGYFASLLSTNGDNAVEITSNGNSASQALRVAHSGTGDNALFEITNAANQGEAVEAHTIGTGNAGYFEVNNTASGTPALHGTTNGDSGEGVYGFSSGSSGTGVLGTATGSFSIGVKGSGLSAGVRGDCGTTNGSGVYGVTSSGGGNAAGVRGDASQGGAAGGAFYNNQGTALYAQSTGGTAGFFSGNVTITGSLQVNGAKNFKIDHPLDPANKYLVHASVESPEMKNIYDGVAVIGADGSATVTMPNYFGALNTEYRYQLTCIGAHAPVYVAEEISQNQFKIAGGKPGMKVSWMVTGVRNDATATSKPMQVEIKKVGDEIGRYLNPEAFGKTLELQIDPMGLTRASKVN